MVGGQRHAPAALPPGTRYIGGWVRPRADLEVCGKSRPPPPTIGITSPDRPVRSESLHQLCYSAQNTTEETKSRMRWAPQVLHSSKGKDMENLINLKGL